MSNIFYKMSKKVADFRQEQEDELEVLKAIYVGDVKEDAKSVQEPLQFSVRLLPQRGSSGGANYGHKVPTYIAIHITIPLEYPEKVPELFIGENKGLSSQEISELESQLKQLALKSVGEVMIYQLLTHAETYLYTHQKLSIGSFHDEMLMRQKQLEEQSLQKQMDIKEKERMAIKEEILRKQEEMRDEVRKLKEQRRSQPSTVADDPSPAGSPNSSPLKGDGFPMSIKARAASKRRFSASAAKRRGRSNSEESDSSLSESSELSILEFVSGKSTSLYTRGGIIGKSDRGTTVYAGMSRLGSLVAISEWRFVAKVDKKGKELKSVASGAGDSMTLEGLLKQISSCELEMNLLQKLEHTNIVLYFGIKVYSPVDEPGIVYVYLAEEFVRGTTLQPYLQGTLSLDLAIVRHCAKGILEGLKFLHDNDIVHRFLRDTSLYLDTNGEIKVTDYGVERKLCELYQAFHKLPDVPDKFPPSIGRGGKKGDIYRFGIIILSLIKGQYVENPPDIPNILPPELQDFLRRCLTPIEHSRWTSTQLLEHDFLKLPLHSSPVIRLHGQGQDAKNEVEEETEDNEELQPRLPQLFKGHSRVHSEFEILKWLGKGGFGDVLKVRNKLDRRIYALKRIRLNPKNKQLNKKITREVKLLSQLNHENVVRYFNSWIETVIESDDERSTTESQCTDTTKSKPAKNLKSPVHLQPNLLKQNSLGLVDNIEDLAPPIKDAEWSISYAPGQHHDFSEDSEESSEDEDMFGTSFRRIAMGDSDDVIFEDGDSESKSSTSASASNAPSNIKRIDGSPKLPSEPQSASFSLTSFLRESQFMYIQMEFCEKSTLRTAIDGNLSDDLDRAWRLFREIVEGLVHIHQQGMIHRDLKPVNIFLDSNDHVKIGDFGLATSSILGKRPDDVHAILIPEIDIVAGHSIDFTEESRTGNIGTALYVAPELVATGQKVSYNQKVDIYSLGVMFFEMFYHPPETAMERVRVILGLRQTSVTFPEDFDQSLIPQVTHITKWLLNHDHTKRPTSLELLQSDYLPPPHLEEAELRDIFSRTLNTSKTKAYKYLVASCFKQHVNPVDDATYDMDPTKFLPQVCSSTSGSSTFSRPLYFVQRVKRVIQGIFERHGAIELSTPLLMPKSSLYEESDTCVNLMCHSGGLVAVPHDLRVPFARYVGRYGISHLKRFSIEKVFRERKVYGLHPRELIECAFDIVDSSQGSLISDAEVLSTVFEILHELPWLRNKGCLLRLGHTKLLHGVMLHYAVDSKYYNQITRILADVKSDKYSKSQIQTHLCSLGLPEHFITMLLSLMEIDGPVAKISNLLKGIMKRKGEAASCIKEGLHELEILINNVESFRLKCTVAVAPVMTFGSHIYSGLLFQVVCDLKRRKNKMTFDVIAVGGRYDELIKKFRTSMYLEQDGSGASREVNPCGVGISISLDKLLSGFEVEDEDREREWGRKGPVNVVICSLGHHPMAKEKIDMMKELLSHGIHASVLDGSQTLESAEEFCKEIGAIFLVILKEDYFSNIRVRLWERGRFSEKKLTKPETLDLISRTLVEGGSEFSSCGGTLIASGLTRSDSLSVKQTGFSVSEITTKSEVLVASNHQASNLPAYNISFIVQERDKLAHSKRRYEHQVMSRISEILMKLVKQQTVEVLGLEISSAVINSLASFLSLHDKYEFSKGVGEVIEKHPRLRKYLNSICDEIFELNYEKNASVIIIYGLLDNSYRVLL